jgi:hypothetical protein
MPFIDADALRGAVGDTGRLGLFTLGLGPFLGASVLVELGALAVPRLRPLRHGPAAGRARLTRAAWVLAALLAGVQGWGVARHLASLRGPFGPLFDALPVPWLALSLLVASLLLAWLAAAMSRRGLGDGLAVLLAVGALLDLGRAARALAGFPVGGPEALLAWVALHAGVAFVAVRLMTLPGAAGGPRAPFPTCGIAPPDVAGSLLAFPSLLVPWFPAAGVLAVELPRGSVAWGVALALLALLLAAVLTGLFCPPDPMVAAWERAGLPEPPTPAQVRQERSRASRRSLALVGLVALLPLVTRELVPSFGVASALAVVLVAAVALDLRSEVRARAGHGPLACARALHRAWLTEPVLAALQSAGVPAWARTRHFRALYHFFAPYAPILVLVPADRLEEAAVICSRVEGEAGGA